MHDIDLGDLSITPFHGGLRLTIEDQQPTTTLSLLGVRELVAYCNAWIAEEELQRHGSASDLASAMGKIGWMGTSGTDMEEHDY